MKPYTVSLFGHRNISNPEKIRTKLKLFTERIISEKQYVQFLIGHDGAFDELAASVISETIRNSQYHTALLIMVLPYMRNEFKNRNDFQQYHQIEICPASANAHFKSAFFIRNLEMLDRSDIVVCWMEHPFGGTFQAVYCAQKKGLTVINLAQS